MNDNIKAFERIKNNINWENWQKEKEQDDEQTEYYDITEVLYSKLEDFKDLQCITDDDFDTIVQIQDLLELLNENKIRRIL